MSNDDTNDAGNNPLDPKLPPAVHVPSLNELKQAFKAHSEAVESWQASTEFVDLLNQNDTFTPPTTPEEIATRADILRIARQVMNERAAVMEFLGKEYQRLSEIRRQFLSGELN